MSTENRDDIPVHLVLPADFQNATLTVRSKSETREISIRRRPDGSLEFADHVYGAGGAGACSDSGSNGMVFVVGGMHGGYPARACGGSGSAGLGGTVGAAGGGGFPVDRSSIKYD
ncbi:hypothetical protein [Burkholderia multivorans]|uniref:hypothetical protein n=1 Tax=Burkholderia multivorans TaxID=87883 RepID=UPI0021BE9CB4|nr:hypothetical protein [Burkholderia multivorans]MDR9177893.1 hypothetical protein [Burkholderia multivorans]MDR9184021.1 hypothetical protein [Burkholderia multivorans]MDR9187493.1 hypothetical protein [Burkholderia multivorans]MDR9195229.1 hypothetical protein [Burkholderia multivorans]MDR9200925.1 hypothetical protein [Burkholderia multivorans]